MKRIFIFLFALTVAVSTLSGAQFTDVSAAEVIEISNYADLTCIAENPDADFYLLNDIDAEDFTWETVPSFSGNFYGNGYSLSINSAPLFGTIESGATVQDLSVRSRSGYGEIVGVIAGVIKGTVKNCCVTGRACGSSIVGGIAGSIEGGTVYDCYASVTLSLDSDDSEDRAAVGGFAGKAENANILRCYSSSEFEKSVFESSACDAGAFVGNNSSSNITNCYYDAVNISQFLGVGVGTDPVVGLDSEQMRSEDSFEGFDFINSWNIIEGVARPRLISINGLGTQQSPYRIHNAEDYAELLSAGCGSANAGRYYRLDSDIEGTLETAGSVDNRFSGIFDGNNHVIRANYNSLFGAVDSGAVVKNIIMTDCNRDSEAEVFGFVAGVNYGAIENCHVIGCSVSGGKDLGGIAGENINGSISKCSVKSTHISGSQTGIGGIVGYNNYGTISECAFRGGIISSGMNSVGGIAGDNSGGLIENCSAQRSIVRTYTNEAGGIAGRLYNGVLRGCYSYAAADPSNGSAGIAGNIIGDGSVQDCYYYFFYDTAGIGSTGDTTGQLSYEETKDAASFNGFDFGGVWAFDSDGDVTISDITGCGTKERPYIIRDSNDWSDVSDGTSETGERNYYVLNNNIYGIVNAVDNFSGSIDGRGHIVMEGTFTGNLMSNGYIGNVVVFKGRVVKNMSGGRIEHSVVVQDITADGGFLDVMYDGSIVNCAVIGEGSLSPRSINGGFVGQMSGGTIDNCYVKDMTVRASNYSGGFVGNNSGGRINNCFVYGGKVRDADIVGGFAGRNDNGGVIENCYTNAIVSDEEAYCGAFVGLNYATIQNVFADNSEVAAFAGIDDGISSNISLSSDGGVMRTEFIKTASTNLIVNDTTIYIPTDRPTTQNVLADIDGHWAEVTIRNLVEKGVVNGYEDGTFRPEENATKGEYIKLLMTAAEEGTSGAFTNYPDVNESWAKGYIARAVDLGICDNINTSEESFGVDEPITRAQAAALMGRLLAPDVTGTPAFTDSADIPEWAANPIYASVQLGLLAGNDDGTFKPMNNLTRAESATIIERIMNLPTE